MKTVTVETLAEAWKRYVNLFGHPPHGTKKQLGALLELVKEPKPE